MAENELFGNSEQLNDLISRQAAIDMLKNRWKKTRHYEGIGDDIAEECELYLKQVPSAQRWISCSERLPKEEEQSYWVCMEDGYQKQCRWKRYEGKDCYIYAWHSTLKVIAWMPLPEPAKIEG